MPAQRFYHRRERAPPLRAALDGCGTDQRLAQLEDVAGLLRGQPGVHQGSEQRGGGLRALDFWGVGGGREKLDRRAGAIGIAHPLLGVAL
jgi:hypothetical protein